jgi:hypothetical protein
VFNGKNGSVISDPELRHLDALIAALEAGGNQSLDGGFVASQGGPICYFRRPLDRSVVNGFIATDAYRVSYDAQTDTVHCTHCWGAVTGGVA